MLVERCLCVMYVLRDVIVHGCVVYVLSLHDVRIVLHDAVYCICTFPEWFCM